MALTLGDLPQKPSTLSRNELKSLQDKCYESLWTNLQISCKMRNAAVPSNAELLVREASYIYPKLLMKKYANLKFRDIMPIDGAGGWILKVVTPIYDITTNAPINSPKSNIIPKVGVQVSERIDNVDDFYTAYDFAYAEMQVANTYAPRIQEAKLAAVDRALEQTLNNLALFGNTNYNKLGLLTDPAITTVTVAEGASGSTRWAYKTPQEILQDIRNAAATLSKNSLGVFNTNQIVMSNSAYMDIIGNPRSDFSDYTVDNFMAKNFPLLERIFGDGFLDNQGANQPTSPDDSTPAPTNIMVIMDFNPEYFRFSVPLERYALPVQYEGVNTVMPFATRSAGFILAQAPSILIVDGI